MVVQVSELGPSCREIPARDNQHKIGNISKKKHLHPRTEDGGDSHNNEKKKVKKENSEKEANSGSCFVALVTDSNLHNDALELPKDFTTSNGFKRECREIVLTDKGERAWSLDLSFNESTETFYVSRGWRSFCNENSEKAGGFFKFNMVGNGEIPVLSFCTKVSRQRVIQRESLSTEVSSSEEKNIEEESSEDDCSSLEMEKKKKNHLRVRKKYRVRCRDSTSPSQNRFVTLTPTHASLTASRQLLPLRFTSENGMSDGVITLLGRDGKKWLVKLRWHGKEILCLGSPWRDFAIANGLKAGESFTLESIWDNATPMLRLLGTESTRLQGECRDSTSPSVNQFVTVTPTHDSLRRGRQLLPLRFTRENGMSEGDITLLGRDGKKWLVKLRCNGKHVLCLGSPWRDFAIANGLKADESFTFELISENATPMLRLLNTESTRLQGECSNEPSSGEKTRRVKTNSKERRDDLSSFSSNGGDNTELAIKKKVKKENPETEADSSSCFVALVTASNLHKDALELPKDFTTSNGFKRECRKIILTDKDEKAWPLDLRFDESSKTFYISRGWRCFCNENSKKPGGFFKFDIVGNGEIPVLSFCLKKSRQRDCSEASRKDLRRCRNSTSPSQNRFVTLTPTYASLSQGRQHLPLPFLIENGITRPRMMNLLGKDGTKWSVNLIWNDESRMSLGSGWKDFAIANGLKVGESFTLELIWENATPMLRLLSTEYTRQQGECSKEPSSGEKTIKAKIKCEEKRDDLSSPNKNRFVTLTLTPQDVRECKLDLPIRFMRDNGINKLGKMTLLGEKGKKWFGYLLSKDGNVAMGSGWKSFCEANGVKIGKSFTLEFIDKQGTYDFVCNFSFNSRD